MVISVISKILRIPTFLCLLYNVFKGMYIRDQVAEYSRKINLPTIETIIFSVFLPQITLAKTPKHSFTPG